MASQEDLAKQTYLQLKVLSTQKRYLPKIETGWSFAKENMPIVIHTIKQYKKSTIENLNCGMKKNENGIKKIDDFVSNILKCYHRREDVISSCHLL